MFINHISIALNYASAIETLYKINEFIHFIEPIAVMAGTIGGTLIFICIILITCKSLIVSIKD